MTMNAEILEENMRALPYFLVKISKIQFQNTVVHDFYGKYRRREIFR